MDALRGVVLVCVLATPDLVADTPPTVPAGGPLPAGFEMRTELADQFVLALPSGWTVYRQLEVGASSPDPRFGMVIFTADPLPGAPGFTTPGPEALARVDSGATPAFFAERRPATRGMGCDGFSRRATYELGTSLAAQVNQGARRLLGALEPRHRAVELGGCAGLAYRFESAGWISDIRAVSDGPTLYLFSLRKPAEHLDGSLAAFEAAMGSLRLAAASTQRATR